MNIEEINGTYGTPPNACTIFVYGGWYCAEGSKNVNFTDEESLVEGVNIETLSDYDTFSWDEEINSLDDLIKAVEA